ncbi:ABC transporter permease [Lactonifactor longoviformis]|uniref:Peptide/nickel transport system permease protein n=1 Tax=Lactonifactor longoviformis DSM 17459 TaxID=1122155 RepID=A0A1M4XN18_9CLOT|nr:ABC transporter permease [Lactonifactor longoviformis]POP31897.1 ABC transporter permease [Lactonifactor longoviformis]SHE94811.1 peptide/nickel transport system permease protein [Lactonifactor longoviformis DSM 17459]
MLRYILKRLVSIIPVLLGISVVVFFAVRLIPGDYATVTLGTQYTEEAAAALRQRYGLDQSIITQYFIWLKGILTGDFGFSYISNQPVALLLFSRVPVTLELTLFSLLMAVLVGIPMGYWAACKRNRMPDSAVTVLGLLGISIPGFWLGTMLVLLFSLTLKWFPSGGFVPLSEGILANLRCMFLPALALGVAVSAVVMRSSRSAMIEVVDQEYMKMGKAKGLSQTRLILKHGVKNTMIQVLTILGLQTGSLLGGSVVIEQIFSLPGVGSLALQAINNRDYLVLQGTVLFIAVMFVLINLIVDLLYCVVNPQIRY